MQLKKLLFGVFFGLFITQTSQAGLGDKLEKAGDRIGDRLHKEIKEFGLKTKVDLLDFDLVDGINLGLRYKYEVEPSFFEEHYTRIESYELRNRINPGELVGGIDVAPVNISFGLEQGTEMTFARQFKSQKDAHFEGVVKYSIKNMPLDAERAINRLRVGDFFATKARMAFSVGAGVSNMKNIVQLSAGVSYVVSGEFQVHIYRMKDNRVRFRAFAIKGKGVSASARARTLPDFKVFGIKQIDNKIVDVFEVDLASITIAKNKTHVFMVDYIFNFSPDSSQNIGASLDDAKSTYNALLQNTFKFNRNAFRTATGSVDEIRELSLASIEPAEKLFAFEKEAQPEKEKRRLNRVFLGFTKTNTNLRRLKYGLILTRFEKSKTFSRTRIRSYDENNNPKDYILSHYTGRERHKKKSLLGKLIPFLDFLNFKMEKLETASALLTATESGEPDVLTDFILRYDLRDKKFRSDEMSAFDKRLERILPSRLYSQVQSEIYGPGEGEPWDNKFDGKFLEKVRVYYQVSFKTASLLALENLSRGEIAGDLEDYLDTIPRPSALKYTASPDHQHRRRTRMWNFLKKTKLVKGLTKAFDASNSKENRLKSFERLRDNGLFRQIAGGFLSYMLAVHAPDKQFEDLVHFSLKMNAKGLREVDLQYGADFDSKVYDAVLYQQSIINNRVFDIRLIEQNQAI